MISLRYNIILEDLQEALLRDNTEANKHFCSFWLLYSLFRSTSGVISFHVCSLFTSTYTPLLLLPTVLFPTLPPFLSTLSGESLPGVIHLSLLTWPLTGLLGWQACMVRITVVSGRWQSNKLRFLSWWHSWEQRGPQGFGLRWVHSQIQTRLSWLQNCQV